ncbi:MAG TPA: endolytic transglycosylase MltG [Devosia sp.]|nr:endolytic transglycosylase MltG [Devosia sp.]
MATDDRKQKRRRSRNGFLDVINGLLMIVVLGLIVGVGGFFWGASQFYSAGPTKEDSTFFVEKGNGLSTIAGRLAEQDLIGNSLLFRAGSWATDRSPTILPGEYKIPAGSSMADILKIITSGKPLEYFVMVNPGQSSYEVAAALNDPALSLTGDPVPVPPEGSVLPVRHDYFPRDDRAAILKAMQADMDAAVDKYWAQCEPDVCGPDGVLKTKQDFVTMASIVEKETGLDSERPIVASLFINRLKDGMRLQTDPTILYGLYKGVPQASLSITASQKAKATDYNTYVIDGLPPTPIANPGEAALAAVANPDATDYLYMMAVTPGNYSDGHYFAKTLKEHQANEKKYRAQEKEQAAQDAAAAAKPQ